ncbi:hypothetical protein SDC9_118018 [bioreactor metagenome]|uniref:Uncharacterized protein n=1 Tax=bioreactor metagenome TaxID=1076179 RepID=A0A645C0J0_9ZZZZ
MDQVEFRILGERRAGNDARAVGAGVADLAGRFACLIEEFLQRVEWCVGTGRQHERALAQKGNRCKVLAWIIGQRFHQARVGCLSGVGGHQQGVPVRLGFCDGIGTDCTVRPGLVLDHKRLLELLGEVLRQHACERVSGCSGGEGNDDPYRLVRVGVLRHGCRRREQHARCDGEHSAEECSALVKARGEWCRHACLLFCVNGCPSPNAIGVRCGLQVPVEGEGSGVLLAVIEREFFPVEFDSKARTWRNHQCMVFIAQRAMGDIVRQQLRAEELTVPGELWQRGVELCAGGCAYAPLDHGAAEEADSCGIGDLRDL